MTPTSLTTRVSPMRGEIWDVDLNPTRGREIKKVLRCFVWVILGDAVPQAPWDLSLSCQSGRV
jgi:mRNA-degrading endonuclease toxin of MazEF toxin-antitoxin module